jgi:hypothetical protein
MKIMLGDFNEKGGREEGYFKLIIGNENLHEVSTDNGVIVVYFATLKNHCQEHNIPRPRHSKIHLDFSRWYHTQSYHVLIDK